MKTKLLHENRYQQILSYPELGIYEERFKAESAEIFGDEYMREVSLFGDYVLKSQNSKNPFRKLIINTLAGGPTMEPKVQDFMHNEFYPQLIEAGITTKAYCLGEEIISKLSVELTAENDPRKQFTFKFFSNLEESLKWLQSV